MSTHSSILAWKIPWTEKPGGLQSMGLQRAGHGLATYLGKAKPNLEKAVSPSGITAEWPPHAGSLHSLKHWAALWVIP